MEEEVGGNARIIGLCVQVAFLCKGIRNCDYIYDLNSKKNGRISIIFIASKLK
jgi:hypothetical protein